MQNSDFEKIDYWVKDGERQFLIEKNSRHITDDVVDQLIACRKEMNMTQQDIADATGIQRSNVARLELKKNGASLDSLDRIAKCLGLRLNITVERADKKSVTYNVHSTLQRSGVAEDMTYGAKKLPLPLGVSDYKRACTEYYYVDKTLLIRDFLDVRPQVALLTRPRRFGKTLNMDMLRTFFEKTDEDTSVYFQDKKIWACGEDYQLHQGKYPVIFLSFKDARHRTWEGTFYIIKTVVRDEYERHKELATSEKIKETDKAYYNAVVNGSVSEYELGDALLKLSRMLHMHHGVTSMIIMDEYDTPIQQGHVCGFYEEVISFMRIFLPRALKDNPHMKYAFLTGILRVAKESLFSGLNNIGIYSVLHNTFSPYFGFTHEEVKQLVEYYEVSDKYQEICDWYDGYKFGKTDIFNPWSVINYLQSDCQPRAYWLSTSSNDIIGEILRNVPVEMYKDLYALLNGQSVTTEIDTSVIYPKIQSYPKSIYSFLAITGYLKTIYVEGSYEEGEFYKVVIPNRELSFVYKKEILAQLEGNSPATINFMQRALLGEDPEELQTRLAEFLKRTISYYDTGRESFYHGLLLGLCAMMEAYYYITSNRESGLGRYDIQLMPKRENLPGILIEIKVQKDIEADALKTLSEEALLQIKEKQYDVEMQSKGVETIYKYGVAFSGKVVEISSET